MRPHRTPYVALILAATCAICVLPACSDSADDDNSVDANPDSSAVDDAASVSESDTVANTDTGADTGAIADLLADTGTKPDTGTESDTAQPDTVQPDTVQPDTVADTFTLPSCSKHADCPKSPDPCADILCAPDGFCTWVQLPHKATCDDGDSCTVGEKCNNDQCDGGKNACGCTSNADCAKLEDGNLCNGTLYCDLKASPSACKVNPSTVVTCPKSTTLCQDNICAPKTGKCSLQKVKDLTPCDDGDKCTKSEQCFAGLCLAGADICDCKTTADCKAKEDGNPCTGTLYCDNTTFPPKCKTNPKSVVTCKPDKDTACRKNLCQKVNGVCQLTALPHKTPCQDGNKCTSGDFCAGGACVPGPDICPCKKHADCAKKEDGNLCNGTLYCDFSLKIPNCVVNPATVVSCPTAANTICKASKCAPKTATCSVVAINHLGGCEDGNPCTQGDVCKVGACHSGKNACQCKTDADCGKHEDGDLCNGTLYCDKGQQPFVCKVRPNSVVRCPSGKDTKCLANRCQKKSGKCLMQAIRNQLPCDADGNPCTKSDVCDKGACIAGTNVCKCQENVACAKYEDGNLCNGTLYCDKLAKPPVCNVNPATKVTCPDGDDSTCRSRRCDPKTGSCPFANVNQGQPCDADGNACTPDDACDKGSCHAGTNVCACTADADCATLDDGNKCNGTLYCDKAKLPFRCNVDPTTVIQCPADTDANDCVAPQCAPLSGKCTPTQLQDNSACSDGEVCTFGDRCWLGQCKSGKNLCACTKDEQCAVYDDGNACNGVFHCDKSVAPYGCAPKPKSEVTCPKPNGTCATVACRKKDGKCVVSPRKELTGKGCDDGDACTVNTTCVGIACAAGQKKSCDDQNPCTHDSCTSALPPGIKGVLGCAHLPVKVTCDDGNPCTSFDSCLNSKCVSGPATNCDDANLCTIDSCDKGGCKSLPSTAKCEDGNLCTVADTCKDGACKSGVKKDCNDKDVCTVDSCVHGAGPKAGCKYKPSSEKCDDGNPCTGGDRCAGGQCIPGDHLGCNDGNPCTDDSCDPTGNGGKACKNVPNTAPCEDGKTCSAGGICKAGKCVSFGKPRLFEKNFGGTSRDEFLAMVGHIDQGALIVGYTESGNAKGGRDGWLLRVNRAGDKVWETRVNDATRDSLTGVVLHGSDALAVGWTTSASTGKDIQAVGLGDTGKIAWVKSIARKGEDEARAAVPGLNEGVVALGVAGGSPAMIGFKSNGATAWIKRHGTVTGEINAGVGLAAGAMAAAGTAKVGSLGKQCLFMLIKHDGGVVKTATFGGGGDQQCFGLTRFGAGYVMVGQTPHGTKIKPWMVRLDSGGGIAWEKSWTDHLPSSGLTVAAAPEGLMFGRRAWLNVHDMRLMRLNDYGTSHWAYNYGAGDVQQPNAIVILPDGGAFIAGANEYNTLGLRDGWLLRVDAWGNEGCYNSGVCADISWTSCSKSDPCKRTVCNPGKGCDFNKHMPAYSPCKNKGYCTLLGCSK